jgi:hypothetical protein
MVNTDSIRLGSNDSTRFHRRIILMKIRTKRLLNKWYYKIHTPLCNTVGVLVIVSVGLFCWVIS